MTDSEVVFWWIVTGFAASVLLAWLLAPKTRPEERARRARKRARDEERAQIVFSVSYGDDQDEQERRALRRLAEIDREEREEQRRYDGSDLDDANPFRG